MAEAINYTLNHWEALNTYPCGGDLAIDNNIAKRAVKPFAIGRKNWLLFGSDQGEKSLSILLSFAGTCQTVQDQSLKLFARNADQAANYALQINFTSVSQSSN